MPDTTLQTRSPETKAQADSTLTGARLADILSVFDRIIDRRPTIPALECVLVDAAGGLLTLKGTDLDNELVCSLPFEGPAFTSLVPHRSLRAAVESFGDEVPGFFVTSHGLTLRGRSGEFRLTSLPADELLAMTRPQPSATMEIDGAALAAAFAKCRSAISREETRYYLMGISAKATDGGLEFAATDGHRLHLTKCHVDAIDGEVPQIIIHGRAINCLRALLERELAPPVAVEISPTKAAFGLGQWTLLAKLIDGTYPDYSRVIPDEPACRVTIDGGEFADALRAIGRCSTPDWKAVAFEPSTGRLNYSDPHGVVFARTMSVIVDGIPPANIGFRPDYMADLLATHPLSKVTIGFGDAAAPMLVTFAGDADFTGVLMPMRIPN